MKTTTGCRPPNESAEPLGRAAGRAAGARTSRPSADSHAAICGRRGRHRRGGVFPRSDDAGICPSSASDLLTHRCRLVLLSALALTAGIAVGAPRVALSARADAPATPAIDAARKVGEAAGVSRGCARPAPEARPRCRDGTRADGRARARDRRRRPVRRARVPRPHELASPRDRQERREWGYRHASTMSTHVLERRHAARQHLRGRSCCAWSSPSSRRSGSAASGSWPSSLPSGRRGASDARP